MEIEGPLKIVRLSAENVKRIKVVEITPTGDVVRITGKNGAGKSSVLDSIAFALGGAKLIDPVPIRTGETTASVVVDLGEIIVKRTWTEKGSYLEVTTPNGMQFKSPQAMLDELFGALTFDPSAFSRMDAKKQRETLLDLLGIGDKLAELDGRREKLYADRRDIGRDVKRLDYTIAELRAIPEDTPDEPISVTALAAALEDAISDHREREQQIAAFAQTDRENRTILDELLPKAEVEAQRLEAEARAAMQKAAEMRRDADIARKEAEATIAETQRLVAKLRSEELPLIEPIRERLSQAEVINANVAIKRNYKRLRADYDKAEAEVSAMTKAIEDIDADKERILQSAEWPIDGLGFDDGGEITFNGIPLAQAAQSEQLKVAVSIGIARHPKLRIMLVRDGSLLDAASMAILERQAKDSGYQYWVEQVDDTGKIGIVIEDGSVVT